jgi:two-component system NarL family sensor kinase
MFIRYAVFLFVLFNFALCLAQNTAIQTQYKKLEQLPEDTSKIFPYYEFGLMIENISLDSAIGYYNKAKVLSDKFDHVKGKIRYASIYTAILNEQGKLDESYKLSLEALKLTEENHLYYEMAKTCNNLGNVLNYLGDFNGSMNYFLRSAAIFEKINRKEHLNVIYQNIGSIYLSLGNYEKCIDYTQRSISLSEEKGDSVSVSNALTNLAGALVSLGRFEEGLRILNRCVATSKIIDNPYAENMAYLGLGNLFTQTGDYEKALEYLDNALVTARKMRYINNLANCLNALATVHFEMGHLSIADKYAVEAVTINEQYKVYNNLRQQYKLIAEIKSKLNQFAPAFNYLQKYVDLNDSLANIETKKFVEELEQKYQTAEKDKQITEKNLRLVQSKLVIEKNKEKIRSITIWLVVAFAVVMILVLLVLFIYLISLQRQKLNKQKLDALKKEQEVIKLKATLDGQHQERQRIAREMHDEIGSGLTTILFLGSGLSGDDAKVKKIKQTSGDLIGQMNEIIWSMNTDQDTVEDLISYIRHNVGEMMDAAKIDYELNVPDNVPNAQISGMQRRNIYLVVKEAVHNIVKHSGAKNVKIDVFFTDGIAIVISDDGKGFDEKINPFGNGMKNMEYRMKQIGGEWKVKSVKPFTIALSLRNEWIV